MKLFLVAFGVVLVLYAAVCCLLYYKQESLLFFPQKMPPDYRFSFPVPFEERWIPTAGSSGCATRNVTCRQRRSSCSMSSWSSGRRALHGPACAYSVAFFCMRIIALKPVLVTNERLDRSFKNDPQFASIRAPDGSISKEFLSARGLTCRPGLSLWD